MIITISMMLLVTGIVAIVSTIDTNKGEYYYCGSWLMEYDKNQNVVSEKFFFGFSGEPTFALFRTFTIIFGKEISKLKIISV